MKNNYLYNNQKIVDLVERNTKYCKRRKMFVLEDGTEIKAEGSMVSIQCTECQEFFSYHFAMRYENKPYLCNHCRILGDRNPFYGKHHSEENKLKWSQLMRGKFVGEKNPMYGKNAEDFMTPEAIAIKRHKQSINLTGERNGMYGESLSAHMSFSAYTEMREKQRKHSYHNFSPEKQLEISKKMSDGQKKFKDKDPIRYSQLKARGGFATKSKAVNYKMTHPEKLVEQFLIEHNMKFDYSCIMGSGKRCYQYDFIIHEKRTLIEVQGDYWHGNPRFYNIDGTDGKKKLNDIQKTKICVDKEKQQFALEKNFKLICIWEFEIKQNDFSKLMSIL